MIATLMLSRFPALSESRDGGLFVSAKLSSTLCLAAIYAVMLFCARDVRGDSVKLGTLQVGAEVYTNVLVTSVTTTDIYFAHSRGMGNAKLKSLTPELQRLFGFEPAKAAETEREQTAGRALYAAALREVETKRSQAQTQVASNTTAPQEIEARSFLNRGSPAIVVEKWLTPPQQVNGRFALIVFWATWSEPCRASIAHLNTLAGDFKDRLPIIGISDQSEEEVRQLKDPEIDFSLAIDTQRRALRAFGVERIPYAVLVDPKGIVRWEGHPNTLEEKAVEKFMDQ